MNERAYEVITAVLLAALASAVLGQPVFVYKERTTYYPHDNHIWVYAYVGGWDCGNYFDYVIHRWAHGDTWSPLGYEATYDWDYDHDDTDGDDRLDYAWTKAWGCIIGPPPNYIEAKVEIRA